MKKRNKIIYWIATLWLASGMLATGVQQLMKVQLEGALSPPGVFGIKDLGYPVYFLTIIGVWKLLGVLVLLIPKFPLFKEWAYAGFVFLLTGAIYSHVAVGHSITELIPAGLLLALTVLSWYFRPDNRKFTSLQNNVIA
jgi:uncharacterized membrane protein YphA (DoxX/SURF4 family)